MYYAMTEGEWLGARKGRVTSTIIPLLAQGKTFQAWAKCLQVDGEAKYAEHGKRYQRATAEYWADIKGVTLIDPPPIVFHPYDPRLASSYDYFAVESDTELRNVEIKNYFGFSAKEFGEAGTDEVPEDLLIQVQWENHIGRHHEFNGRRLVDEASLVHYGARPGVPPQEYPIAYDWELCGVLEDVAKKFLRDWIESGKVPPVDHSEVASEWLARRYSLANSDLQDATAEDRYLAMQLEQAARAARQINRELDLMKNRWRERIGEALGVRGEFGVIKWTPSKMRESIDWKAVAMDLGATEADIEKYKTEKPGPRVFTHPWSRLGDN